MFSDPQKNITQAHYKLGSTIVDFGSGSGHYVRLLSAIVGEKGTVIAIDIQKELLAKIKKEATAAKMKNVEVLWGDLEVSNGTKLKSGSVDGVIISNLLFQVKEKEMVAKEAGRILKSGGTVTIIDWSDTSAGIGPKPDQVVSKVKAEELFSKNGFLFEREIDAGSHHYGIILKKV